MTENAIDFLATKIHTPLQVQQYLTWALEAAHQAGERPISAEIKAFFGNTLDPTRTARCIKYNDNGYVDVIKTRMERKMGNECEETLIHLMKMDI